MLWDDRDETFNNISNYSKLAQKEYKTTHITVIKIDYNDKWFTEKQNLSK